jgi:hypothetical protein
VGVLLNNGRGVFATPIFYATGESTVIATGDLNADGKLDLITFGNSGSSPVVSVLLNNSH